jgi:hypothetical protein
VVGAPLFAACLLCVTSGRLPECRPGSPMEVVNRVGFRESAQRGNQPSQPKEAVVSRILGPVLVVAGLVFVSGTAAATPPSGSPGRSSRRRPSGTPSPSA